MIFILPLLILNFVAYKYSKTNNRYWQVAIPLWALLFILFISVKGYNTININKKEHAYQEKNKVVNREKLYALENSKDKATQINLSLLSILMVQTVITFVLQIKGRRETGTVFYKRSVGIFAVLTIVGILLFIRLLYNQFGSYII